MLLPIYDNLTSYPRSVCLYLFPQIFFYTVQIWVVTFLPTTFAPTLLVSLLSSFFYFFFFFSLSNLTLPLPVDESTPLCSSTKRCPSPLYIPPPVSFSPLQKRRPLYLPHQRLMLENFPPFGPRCWSPIAPGSHTLPPRLSYDCTILVFEAFVTGTHVFFHDTDISFPFLSLGGSLIFFFSPFVAYWPHPTSLSWDPTLLLPLFLHVPPFFFFFGELQNFSIPIPAMDLMGPFPRFFLSSHGISPSLFSSLFLSL